MNEPLPNELRARLEELPINVGRPSKLEPYRDLILRWRRQGRSYRTIQEILLKECRVKVHYRSIHKFVKLRSRPRKQRDPESVAETAATVLDRTEVKRMEKRSDPYAEVRARMARDKAQPVQPKPAKAFEYTDEDSIRPIVLLKPEKEN